MFWNEEKGKWVVRVFDGEDRTTIYYVNAPDEYVQAFTILAFFGIDADTFVKMHFPTWSVESAEEE